MKNNVISKVSILTLISISRKIRASNRESFSRKKKTLGKNHVNRQIDSLLQLHQALQSFHEIISQKKIEIDFTNL